MQLDYYTPNIRKNMHSPEVNPRNHYKNGNSRCKNCPQRRRKLIIQDILRSAYLQFKPAQAKFSLNPLPSGKLRLPHKYQSSPYHCSCPPD